MTAGSIVASNREVKRERGGLELLGFIINV